MKQVDITKPALSLDPTANCITCAEKKGTLNTIALTCVFLLVKQTRHFPDPYFGKQNRILFMLNSCKYMHVIYHEG